MVIKRVQQIITIIIAYSILHSINKITMLNVSDRIIVRYRNVYIFVLCIIYLRLGPRDTVAPSMNANRILRILSKSKT